MLDRYLSKRDFPIRKFLNELEKRELLFLLFLTSHEREEEVDFIYQHTDDMEHFFKVIQKTVGTKIKKLPKDELVDQIAQQYEENELTSVIYKNIYQHAFDSDMILFNSKLVALERFTSMIFLRKIEKIQNDYLAGKLLKKHRALEEFEKRIIHTNKPVLNSLGIISLIGKIDYALKHLMDSIMAYDVKDHLYCVLMEQFEEIEKEKIDHLTLRINKQGIALKNKERDSQKKDEQLSKAKEQNRKLITEIKAVKKELETLQSKENGENQHELINKLYVDIQKKDKQLEQYVKDLKKAKEEPNPVVKRMLEGLQEQVANLKAQEKEKSIEYKNMKRKLDTWESKTIENHLQEYIESKGFTKRLYDYLEPYVTEFRIEQEEIKTENQEQESLEDAKKEQKIGYCLIENNIHYVVFPDGTKIEIQDIPDNIYLGEWQFVKVESDGTFKWAYGYKYDENERDYLIYEFGSVIYKNGEPYLMKAVWDEKKLEKVSSHIKLRENQVVSVNGKGELLRFYRAIRHNLDHCMSSIKAKGQEAYYVLKIFPNGILLRNIETNVEEFKVLNLNGQEVKEQQILCVREDTIIHVFYSAKMYTFSQFYKKAENGIVELKNEMVFIRKLSGEVVIVNEIPERFTIEDGDIITVDEFNNYMMMKKADVSLPETDERKRLSSSPKITTTKKQLNEKIEVEKEVLVLGKITYENSYKMSLFKKGYRAEVIEGYEPWTKVKSSLKGKDVVVVVTDYISHDNMWRIKDEVLNIPVIYSEFDGANRILEQIESLMSDQQAM